MPSLLEILNDPNYVNANEATKAAIFNRYSAQDKNFTGANESTKEAIRKRFGLGIAEDAASIEPPDAEPTKDTGFFDMTGRAIVRGAKQTGSLLADVLPAMAAKAVGADEYAARQMAEAEETRKEIAQKYAARYGELSDVKGIGDVLPFVAETIAEQIPNIATAIVPGAGGAAIGARMAAGQAAKTLGAREATEASARYAALKGTQGAAYGGGAGAFLGSYALNAPEVFKNIFEKTGQMEVGASVLAGSVAAALDSILPAYLVRQFTPGMKMGVVENLLEKSGMPAGVARGATAGALTGIATEGPTEAAQEAISIAAEKFVQENPEVWGSKEFNRLVESGVRGAVGGGGISGIAGGVKGFVESRPAAPKKELATGKNTFDQLDAGETEEETSAAPPANIVPPKPPEPTPSEATLSEATPPEPKPTITDEQRLALDDERKELLTQIAELQGEAKNLRDSDPERADQFSLAAQDLQVREREIRRTLTESAKPTALDAEAPRQYGGPRQVFKLTDQEKAVTEEDLSAAGFGVNDIKNILASAKPLSTGPKTKETLRRVANGEVLFNNVLRSVTQDDIDNAVTPEEKARLQSSFDKAKPQSALFAPSGDQLGFDVSQPEGEVERNLPPSLIELGSPEFRLERPPGVAPGEVDIEAPAATQGAPLNMFTKTGRNAIDFLQSINPIAEAEQGVNNFKSAIKNFIDDINEYINTADAQERGENRQLINEFFDQYSITDDPKTAGNLINEIKNKNPAQQKQILGSRTRMPDLTRLGGVSQLRQEFNDFMARKKTEQLGYTEEQAALNTFATDTRIPKRVSNILARLKILSPRGRTPEENAAFAYFSRWNYGVAMRSAAFDIVSQTPPGEMFSGQGAKQAELFRKYIEENFPASEVEKFDRTVETYRYDKRRAYGNTQKLIQYRQKIQELKKTLNKSEEEIQKALRETTLESRFLEKSLELMHPAVQQAVENNDLNLALDLIRQMPRANTYWSALASRLRELNLPTSIGFNQQRILVEIELQKVQPSTTRLMDNMQLLYPDVYNKYFRGNANNPVQMLAALQKVRDDNLIPSILTNDNLLYERVLGKYKEVVPALTSLGTYFIEQDVINLNKAKGGLSLYGLFHETIHAATSNAIRNRNELNTAQKVALSKLENLYEYTLKNYPAVYQYGFKNLDEFVAEAFSNMEFQSLLRDLKYQNTDKNLWSTFVKFIVDLLGGNKDNVLAATLANADVLMSATVSRGSPGMLDGTLNASAPKSVMGGTFKTAPLPPDQSIPRRMLNAALNRPTWQNAKNGVSQMLENVADTTRKHFLGAFTLRQLQDLVGTRLGQAPKNFILSVEGMLEEHNKIVNEAKSTTDKWSKLQNKDSKESDKLSEVMIEATLLGIDPDTQKGKDYKLDKAWDALSPEAKEVYREVRDFYVRRMDSYLDTLLNNIKLSLVASGLPDAEVRQKLSEVEKEFRKGLVGPYFPLARFGQFWINVGQGPDAGFYKFDTAAERNSAFKLFEQQGNTKIGQGNSLRTADLTSLQNVTALKTINDIVDSASDKLLNGTYVNYKQAGNQVDTLRNAIKDGVQELYLMTLPNRSLRKNFIHRKGVSGASKDMLRAFSDTSSHMAYQHARFKYSRQMFDQLNAADEVQKANIANNEGNPKVDGDYLNELRRRLDYVMNPTDTGTIPTVLSNVSFLWYLTAPASALVNMLGVPAFGLPVLASRFGKVDAAAMLASMGMSFMRSGFKDANGKFAMPSLKMGSKLNAVEQRAYDAFSASGLIDITQAYDLAGLADSPSNMYTGKMSTIMRWSSFMFHHAERFNREVMAMSAFRLSYAAAKKKGMSDLNAFNKAVDEAKDLTYRSMFDYSTLNKPRYLQNAYAKVILQFKQFPQHTTYLLGRSAYEWFSKNNPELRDEVRSSLEIERANYGLPTPATPEELEKQIDAEVDRIVKEGRGRILGTLGMTFLIAGATGMPLFSIGAATIEALHAAFSDEDEPPLDFENWFKNWMAETFGNFWGDSVSRGVVTQTTGLNIADRMSLNDLWFRDARKSQDEVTAFQNMLINLLGPTASLGISAAEALKLYNDGQYYRGAEKIMPAVLKQPLVGMRYATEGVLTLKGDELVSDISGKDALAQSLGFSPERVAQRQKSNIEKKSMEQDIINKRQDLLNAFFMSIDTQDPDFTERVVEKIGSFNRTYPSFPISPDTLRKSVKTRYKARALAEVTGGIPINKKLMSTLEDMGYYGD
jgi:hypothetical protein